MSKDKFSFPTDLMQSSMESMRMQQEIFQRERDAVFHDRNPVIKVCEALRSYILSFEGSLDEDHEIGARLVSFGHTITFHVQQIGFTKPNIVTFVGLSETGDRVQLIQHVSQLSFLLIAMKKLGDKPNRIGFVWND